MDRFKVTFYPFNKTVEATKGQTLLSVAISAGIYINSICGGEGVCGKCKVILKKGKVATQPTGKISSEERRKNYYLACITTVESDLEIEIPESSILTFEKITSEEIYFKEYSIEPESVEVRELSLDETFGYLPLAMKLYLNIPPPDLNDRTSDLERLYREIRRYVGGSAIHTELTNIRQLGEILRSSDWKITVTLGRRDETVEILSIEPYDTSKNNYGLVFDIGTTTIWAELIDLKNKSIIETNVAYNRQAIFGPDIITRIIYAQHPEGLEKLHRIVVEELNQIIVKLTRNNNIDLNDVTYVLCAGNPTMIHLLLKINPIHIRKEPYVTVANFIPTIKAKEIGIIINPQGLLYCVPSVSSYLGGDIIAGVLFCGMDRKDKVSLLVDLGTNGEVVLGNCDFLIGCSASAGPAFEGSGMTFGMRASPGAIQKLRIKPQTYEVEYTTIGCVSPRGICGSGYIDILAHMLITQIIDRSGRIQLKDSPRVRETDYGKEFIVAFNKEASLDTDIVITEADIDNLKRAKAAIFAAISVLMKHTDLDFNHIDKIFIAGGFGNYLDINNAKIIGLLPDLEDEKFVFVGNSSLAGARQILLSYQAMQKAKELAKKITYFELSTDPRYMEEYMAALFFPHTDLLKFPNIRNSVW